MANVFIKPDDEYTQKINPIKEYIHQSAKYLQIMTGDSYEECKQYVVNNYKNNALDPTVVCFERETNGDSLKQTMTLSTYIERTISESDVIVPSFTTYIHPKIIKSQLSQFVEGNLKQRSVAKKEAFKQKQLGDMVKFITLNNIQANLKLYSNSMSGAYATKGCILYNPTGHSTLTSTIRTVSSFGNAINERMISGNRHYWSPNIALNNIISIVSNVNLEQVNGTLVRYNLKYPTIEDTVECVKYSTDLYWNDAEAFVPISQLISRLSPIERACVCYIGDLYHVRKYNDSWMRVLLSKLSVKMPATDINPMDILPSLSEMQLNLAHHICYEAVKGFGTQYDQMEKAGILNSLVSTAINIDLVLQEYSEFIHTFFLTEDIPPSVAYIRNSVRRAVVMSDTDSTCASYQEWVEWMYGNAVFNEVNVGLAASVMTLSTQVIGHALSILSANMNVEKEKLHSLAMKNEYTWAVFCPTNLSKHYFASTVVREGNVYPEPELEIKGVHLKNSNAPKRINQETQTVIKDIYTQIALGNTISLYKYLTMFADTEREIFQAILLGDLQYYRRGQIKSPDAYTLPPNKSPYQHYILWQEVFEPKYGYLEPPPMDCLKISTMLTSKRHLKSWLESIRDLKFRLRMTQWLENNSKTELPTMFLPTEHLRSKGMIEEIMPIIDARSITLELCNSYYILLESVGFYKKKDKLLSELGY